ncbi:MAG: hypothetical protein AAF478_11255 [Pseudomonadota bacterium]
MYTIYEPIDAGVVARSRNTFSTNLLTEPQYEEIVSFCCILHRETHRSASFIEKLETLAFAFSRTAKGINASKADMILRDTFKSLFGRSLDQLRNDILKRQENLNEEELAASLTHAYETLKLIENGNKITFHRASSQQAAILGAELGISDIFAKKVMSEQFAIAEGIEFYEAGKQAEDRFYRPQIEAEKRKRTARGSYTSGSDRKLADNLGIDQSKSGGNKHPAPTNG